MNGLDALKMNKTFGVLKQHPTLIKMKQGCLGPFHYPENSNMVQVGEMQSLVWLASELNSDEDGPVYLPPQKLIIEREDRLVPVKLKKDQTEFEPKDKTRSELIKDIMEEDKFFSMLLGGQPALEKKSLKELQRDSRNLGIDKIKILVTVFLLDIWEGARDTSNCCGSVGSMMLR